jgi:hypothetical protein
MAIAINAPIMTNEYKIGGLWNSKMAKSAMNKLVNKGWSRHSLITLFFIVFQSDMAAPCLVALFINNGELLLLETDSRLFDKLSWILHYQAE